MTKAKFTEAEIKAVLARKDLTDEHRALVAIADFDRRGRAPSTAEIAEFLGWSQERTESTMSKLGEAGLAAQSSETEPKS